MQYEVVLTNCESGKPKYFSDFINENILKSVERASYSMLVLSRMIKIKEQFYMDGGISNAIPVNRAYEMGYKRNIVILCTNRKRLYHIPTYQKILYERSYRKYPMFLDTLMNLVLLENSKVQVNTIYCSLDDKIPFCEYFVVPYLLWYVFIGVTVFYFGVICKEKEKYVRLTVSLCLGMTMFLIVSFVYPNGHTFRPKLGGNSIFSKAVFFLYKVDTPICKTAF